MKIRSQHSSYTAARTSLTAMLGLWLMAITQAQVPALQWAAQSSSPANNIITAMAVDGEGNTIVAVSAAEEFTFAGVQIPFVNLLSSTASGTTLIKLDPDGQLLWHRSLKGPWQSWAFCGGIDTDDDNNVYVSYAAWSSVQNATPIGGMLALSTRPRDHFLLKLGPDGTGLWFKVANTLPGTFSTAAPLCKAGPDGLYWMGDLGTSVSFDGVALSNTGIGSTYMVKHDLDGNMQWAKSFGNNLGSVSAWSMIVGGDESIYIAGTWEGDPLHVDAFSLENDLAFTGNADRWICKLDAEGTAQWLRREHSAGSEWISNMALTPEGDLILVSLKDAAPLFIGDVPLQGAGVVLSRYSDAGEVLGGMLLGDLSSSVYALPPAITLAENGAWYMTGIFFEATYNFGGLDMINAGGNAGTMDIFIAKMNQEGQADWVFTIGSPDSELTRFVSGYGTDQLILSGFHTGTGLNIQGLTLLPHTEFIVMAFVASFSTTLATRSAEALKQLLVYPNPFSETLHFDTDALQAFQNASLTIFNSSGTEVYRAQLQGKDPGQFNLGHLPKGAYIARISDGSKSLHTKIVKQ